MATLVLPTRQTESEPPPEESRARKSAASRVPSSLRLLEVDLQGGEVGRASSPDSTAHLQPEQWRDLWEQLNAPQGGFHCTQTTVSTTGSVLTVSEFDEVARDVSRLENARPPVYRVTKIGTAAGLRSRRPIWEIAVEIGAEVPDEEWAKLPRDLSMNLDAYLYGEPESDA
jgi:hypothetical protein